MNRKKFSDSKDSSQQQVLEQTIQYEKKIYDLEQLLDIAKSFCQNLDFSNLLESIVYICMAQMHVLGAEIFVRDLITNENFILETSKDFLSDKKTMIPVNTAVAAILNSEKRPLTFEELKKICPNCEHLKILETLNPTLIVPLIQKNHLNGMLVLQERIAIEDDASYSEYELNQIMSIASLASVAINNAALLEMSSTDMMTHLKLKYYFFNLLTEAIDAAFLNNQHIAVIMFDIDFFKKFNDTYGHECGDFVLKSVADLIRKNLRESDVASRYGGEEFTALLLEAGKDEAMAVAERIRSTINEHDFVYNDQHLHVTISGGVSVFDAQTNLVSSPNEFVNQADQGLYMSKNNGRNRVTYFDPKLKSSLKSANAKK
ncbi:diguanylate cyclase with GAF sensor [Treponema bryantii]|uniref:diguanylate cyclase n=1 Tax=Treponema bryantii TaxID=163 RepID=A0A1H9CP63_9SPIR|nr:diguanylate cyclase DgcA [Treponema bryantii]BDC92350.1 diguanylate cyclase [Treponema bryantii]SEQ02995.1 diguanylate cyclase with GAF sensor [Treponema bryantii]